MAVAAVVWRSRLAWCVKFSREPQSKVSFCFPGAVGGYQQIRRRSPERSKRKTLKNRD
jgi:hypothetical protein